MSMPDAAMNSSRTAVITGGGTGIGRATALELGRRGWNVVLLGRRPEPLEETARAIDADGSTGDGRALAVPTDVTDPAAVTAAFDAAVSRFGRIDLLFNNAGSFGPAARVDEISEDDWAATLAVNVTASVRCAGEAFRRMREQSPQGGRIVTNGSVSARVPRPASVAYATTKHALTGLSRSIALDGRPFGITCCQIDIGNAATELLAGVGGGAGALQADGSRRPEPSFDVAHAAKLVADVADLPNDVAVHELVVAAAGMPYDGRG